MEKHRNEKKNTLTVTKKKIHIHTFASNFQVGLVFPLGLQLLLHCHHQFRLGLQGLGLHGGGIMGLLPSVPIDDN